jgi:2-hydroxychromene-2-carboxylate isomerase
MPRNIDYYFSLLSPWAYIGHVPFMEIVRGHDVKVTYKPILLANVYPETGGLPFPKRHPVRLRYRILELQRWREKRGLKFNLHPKFWPFNAEMADRIVVAVAAAGHDPDPFLRRAFAAIWEEEQNLADDATLISLADGVKLPGRELLADAKGDGSKTKYEQCQGRHRDRSHRFTMLCARRRGVLGPGSARSSGRRAPVRTQAVSLRRMTAAPHERCEG